MQEIDLTKIQWLKNPRGTSSTDGCYLKGIDDTVNPTIYYKLSNYDYYKGIIGHESINEIIAYRLGSILGFNCLDYKLIKAKVNLNDKILTTFLTSSVEFKKSNESKIRFEDFYEFNKLSSSESPLNFAIRMGFEDLINQMLLFDFLIINRDRHGVNMEVLKSEKKYRLAPLFDNGMSFLAPLQNCTEQYKDFNVMSDKLVNNFIGSRSLFYNLTLISKPVKVNPITSKTRESIFYGLEETMPKIFFDKVWEIIERRFYYAEHKKILIYR